KGLAAEDRKQLAADLEARIQDTVYPAYQRLIAYEEHLESVASDDDGVWKLPDGDAYYDQCLRDNTTTDLPADSIHSLGLSEVARIQTEMKQILAEHGEKVADPASEINKFLAEPRFHFPPGDSGRALIIADYQKILDDAN